MRPEQKADSKRLTIDNILLGNAFERAIGPHTANTQPCTATSKAATHLTPKIGFSEASGLSKKLFNNTIY